MKYKVGDKVRIVSKWPEDGIQNSDGLMDKWLTADPMRRGRGAAGLRRSQINLL